MFSIYANPNPCIHWAIHFIGRSNNILYFQNEEQYTVQSEKPPSPNDTNIQLVNLLPIPTPTDHHSTKASLCYTEVLHESP